MPYFNMESSPHDYDIHSSPLLFSIMHESWQHERHVAVLQLSVDMCGLPEPDSVPCHEFLDRNFCEARGM